VLVVIVDGTGAVAREASDPCSAQQDAGYVGWRATVARQCQGEVAASSGGWILRTWCLARTVGAAFGLACMRFVGIRCEGPAGVT